MRSFITNVIDGGVLPLERPVELRGIAFDSGAGLKAVDVSLDGGTTWRPSKLGADLGRYSFREWRMPVSFPPREKPY